ncbi:MAG: twin-arginine translocation signal domain-containing protein [Methanobacteriota archaeon]|nr:MAG: twin-arginine translocation signal domain-containing protein [Euryarchaeota archaeon]TMA00290.1 MAG: twin-arginine translocation signal domain-containing protein [Euryarchaeota archaeon]
MMIRIQRRRPPARENRTVVTSAVTHDEIRGASLRRRRRAGWDGVVHPIPRRGIDMGNQPKNKMSRRNFLRNAAMGAATVGALAAAPSVLGLTENVGADTSFGDGGVPLMAYVKDASTGTVVVMWGTKEIVTKDTSLASRLLLYTRG